MLKHGKLLATTIIAVLFTSILVSNYPLADAQMGALDLSTGAAGLDSATGTGASASSILPILPILNGTGIGNGTIRNIRFFEIQSRLGTITLLG